MSKKREKSVFGDSFASSHPQSASGDQLNIWQTQLGQVAERFNRQYQGKAFELPAEVEAMPIFREWIAGTLQLFSLSLAGLGSIFLRTGN